MDTIIFLDLEVSKATDKIVDIGLIYNQKTLHTSSLKEAQVFIEENVQNSDKTFLCGHNVVDFDIEKLKDYSLYNAIKDFHIIDTLPLSLLLFNEKSVHSLPKNYKDEDDFLNDPLEDCRITQILLKKLITRFDNLEDNTKNIFYSLLSDDKYFDGFFKYLMYYEDYQNDLTHLKQDDLIDITLQLHKDIIINQNYLKKIISKKPVQLAYIIAVLTPHIEIKAHPPKVLYSYDDIVQIQKELCFDIKKIKNELNKTFEELFGYDNFRDFEKLNPSLFGSSRISQKEIVEASLEDKSFLTVLPTGGGKTYTFWLPAIIKAKTYKSLSVVISPLQALIEDHIKSFNSQVANYKAVAISGFMSPLQRQEAIEQVINAQADILYLAPESLRSNVIFNILKNRYIERFIIDEAHCLSTWGNDFRQDYYFICEYIKELLEKKPFQNHIPISCFTATAKPSVIKDIKVYFRDGLNLKLDEFIAKPERKNLIYKSIVAQTTDKYSELLKLINSSDGSTLVYIPSSTKDCDKIAQQLLLDTNKVIESFHSKIQTAQKMKILKDYIENKIDIIVATTAFGMGVDKPNITTVIHYEISDSLESYAQEAGRGARDINLEANCPLLYDENDLDKHFASLNRSKITASEINSIFRVLKKYKRDVITKTAFELANDANWDVEDNSNDYTTKIKTALLELEREGYISRKRNQTKFFADSVASDSINKLNIELEKLSISEDEEITYKRVLQFIQSQKNMGALAVDELAHILGYEKSKIAQVIFELKQMNILGDSKDLSLEFNITNLNKFDLIKNIENALFEYLREYYDNKITIKELNTYLYNSHIIKENKSNLIKDIIKNWKNRSNFIFKRISRQNDLWYFEFISDSQNIKNEIKLKHTISKVLLEYFLKDTNQKQKTYTIEFSLKSLLQICNQKYNIKQIDKTLLYLHHLQIIELLNGRFINYSPMQIYKEDKIFKKRKYTQNEYKARLEKHYTTKIESIHIMGEYAKKLNYKYDSAMSFIKDYFTLDYEKFKKKYNLLKEKITRPITQHRYNKIFAKMSDEQRTIINDKTTKAMMILAGPGSGKTKVLVHKIASLILTEDIKPEQFMMLTFSRTAMREFKSRLNALIGMMSFDVDIDTFHSYSLKLIARNIDKDDDILTQSISLATQDINNKKIQLPYKRVLVLDEFQDINSDSFELVKAIYNANNQEMRIIAVGDDDQCIMEHIGANTNYIEKFRNEFSINDDGENLFKQYELLTNYRSKNSIVNYSNNFISNIKERYKKHPLSSNQRENGIVLVYSFLNSFEDLITPTIELVKQIEKPNDIAILAYTNDEVMQIYSHLQALNINAKFIIDKEHFYLKNIVEVVRFDEILNEFLNAEIKYQEEYFENALLQIHQEFDKSKNIALLEKIIDKFLEESDEYYVSQWLAYLDEIKIEEFESYKKSITVSTIHKSKGMEFDKVFLLIDKKYSSNEEKNLRLYYVGMTRAKNELNIIKNTKTIHEQPFAKYIYDEKSYPIKQPIYTYMMSLKNIVLGYDYTTKLKNHSRLQAGQKVKLQRDERYKKLCIIYDSIVIAILSKSFSKEIEKQLSKGYIIDEITIDYIVWWYNKDENRLTKIPLCKVILKKNLP